MGKIFGKNIVNITGNKKKNTFWPHLLLGMLALFLLPASQDFEQVKENLETNYQSLQQIEQNKIDITVIQPCCFTIDFVALLDFPKFSSNLPHFYTQIVVRQRPIRAGPAV
ncbi:secA translation cis-regulator SecM [Volucribacter amazonae]|uniref:Uncharacterized protein n=1 Tax=Volucribacter amazonae TaxID=256731 RepID=A0A9X4PBL0_9PAST|nr:secA translation cis-regulator SecM [Volucribacter amazonae]MDG6894351.1 hypothetical protein [Volucribacter amazonae]